MPTLKNRPFRVGELTDDAFQELKKRYESDADLPPKWFGIYLALTTIGTLDAHQAIAALYACLEMGIADLYGSPYSLSFYSSANIGWNYKPLHSYRLSNHWNFTTRGQVHCRLPAGHAEEDESCWMLAQYDGQCYHPIYFIQ